MQWWSMVYQKSRGTLKKFIVFILVKLYTYRYFYSAILIVTDAYAKALSLLQILG